MVGFWFARQAPRRRRVRSLVKMVNALPRVVLAPIFTLWLGLGIWSKVALGVTLVFFIVFFNVYQGVKEVSTTVLDNGRMLGMSERQLMRMCTGRRRCRGCSPRCTPPSALPWSARGRRISGSAGGLGYLIQQPKACFDVAGGVRRHVRAVRLRHPDRHGRDAGWSGGC